MELNRRGSAAKSTENTTTLVTPKIIQDKDTKNSFTKIYISNNSSYFTSNTSSFPFDLSEGSSFTAFL